jgi:hypothetical protein
MVSIGGIYELRFDMLITSNRRIVTVSAHAWPAIAHPIWKPERLQNLLTGLRAS